MAIGCFLETTNLCIRPLVAEDVNGEYVNWLNDADVCSKNRHHVYPFSAESARAFINTVNTSSGSIVLAICLKSNEYKHIGNISLNGIDMINRNASLAILMGDKSSWGKGFGFEACFALMRHAFLALGLERVHCATFATNISMQKIAKKLRMQEEGRKRSAYFKDGKFVDTIEYSILQEEFFEYFGLDK